MAEPERGEESKGRSRVTDVLRDRDPEALKQLLASYRPMLTEMARQLDDSRLRVKQDRSDLVQETYVSALVALNNLKAQNSRQFLAWLRALLMNNIRMRRRRFLYSRKRNVRKEVSLDGSSRVRENLGNIASAAEQRLQTSEQVERLLRAVSNLPEPLQAVLRWRYEDGLSYREIGQRVQRSEDAVRMLIARCLKSLMPKVVEPSSST